MVFDLKSFKGLFFDIYATLIDWEEGIYPFLLNLSQKIPAGDALREDNAETRRTLLKRYFDNENAVEHENPTTAYPYILEAVYDRIAGQLGVKTDDSERIAFGRSIGKWKAFPDTVEAMKVLAKHYKLFVLSNVDKASFSRTMAGPLKGVHWDGIYTAEEIGSYKPDPANYNFVVDRAKKDFNIEKNELCLVAQSLDLDHVNTTRLGFEPGVWISRYAGKAAMGKNMEELKKAGSGDVNVGATYNSLGELAEAVEKAWASTNK
ncbi:HAD-like protein [Tothia fuscella]|uniref:HAD-like protein n=1 Tax=Tothia fuscella TaxID=1048955 RepID=A0A9P4NQE2_9PEZI|nr:HAD-like protein [Tothia fuscella]